MTLNYITGNQDKIRDAEKRLESFGIKIVGEKVSSIVEPQTEDIKEIALSKATQAFTVVQKPLIVNDAGWNIPSLNGFPGAYMAYINSCFTANDFLKLMQGKDDRTIMLREVVVYIDQEGVKSFELDYTGIILEEAKGEGRPSDTIASFTGDGRSLAQNQAESISNVDSSPLWNELGAWLSSK